MIRGSVKLDLKKIGYARGSGMNKAVRIAINKAAVPVKAAVMASAPKDVGNLRQSLRIRSRWYAKSKVWAVIVGPSSSFSRVRKKPKRVKPAKKKTPNKTLQALKKKADALRKKAGRKLGKAAGKFASRVVKAVAGRKGQKLLKAATKKQKTPKPPKLKPVKPKPKQRRKRKWNGKKVRPARYAHLTQWGSAKISGRHWLERALSRSRGQFANILTSALKTEIAALMNR